MFGKIFWNQVMKTIVILASVVLVSSLKYNRKARQSFVREAVERRSDYPFKNQLVPSPRYELETSNLQKSNLMEHVFGYFNPNIRLRSAVESLPLPVLSFERSYLVSERQPLRDAVERRPAPDLSEYRQWEPVLRSSEDIQEPSKFQYQVSYDMFDQFDPNKYQLLPQGVHFVTNNDGILGRRIAVFNNTYLNKPEAGTDDSVEILPEVYDGFRSAKKQKLRNKGKKPWTKYKDSKNAKGKEYKVVCYVEGWAHYRREPMTFSNVDIDPFACTHVIYAFAAIDPHSYHIYPQDEEYDLIKGGYRSVVGLKRYNPDLKVLISVSGWADSDGKFSKMTSTASRRQKFIRSVAKFLDVYGFDGLDLDWEFPGVEELGGSKSDKENFSLLIEELSEVFAVNNWIISAAVSSSRFKIEDGYEVSKLSKYLDIINLMAFDLHAEREEVADHHAPLYRRDHDHGLDVFYNADYAVRYWLKKGATKEKITLGIPFFGRSFTLYNSSNWEPGSEVRGMGREGKYTQENGFMAYFEICDKILRDGWSRHQDSVGSPFAVQGDQWIGYDDIESVMNKVDYIKKNNLGGAVVYSLDLDDFSGYCGEKWPLLNTVRRGLAPKKPFSPPASEVNEIPSPGTVMVNKKEPNCTGQGYARDQDNCRVYYRCEWGSKTTYLCPDGLHFDEVLALCNWPEQAGCNNQNLVIRKLGIKDEDYKIVCYFTNWAWYRKEEGKFVPENLDPRLCTHIVYAFASLDPETLTIKSFDPWADLENNFYHRITSLSEPKSTVMLAIGGWTDSTGDKYSRLVNDVSSRRKFVSSAVEFLQRYKFGGLHVDWNYPKCWQSNCNKGPDSDKLNFALLIKELREAFDQQNPPLVLAVGLSGYREVIDVAYDIPRIADNVAFMSVMTYDYHGSWEQKTGHVSPLFYRQGDSFPRFNTNYTLEYIVQLGAPRQKLVMGIPFYGQSFTLANPGDNSYGAKAEGPGDYGEFTKQPGMLSYYEICQNIRKRQWSVRRDAQGATGPYAFHDTQWVGYDDVESVKTKANFVRSQGYGGAMAWTVDLDDFNNKCCRESFPLLKTIGRVLGHISEEEPIREDCRKPPPPVTPLPPVTTTGVDTGESFSSTTEHHHEMTTKPSSTTWPPWTRPTTTTTTTTQWPPWTTSTTTTRKPWWETTSTPSTTTTTTSTTTTPRPTTITSTALPVSTTDLSSTVPCEPGRYYPDPSNCNAYFRCILGEYRKEYCLGGLHWNPSANVCDWPESAKCDKQNFVEPTTTQSTVWWTEPSSTTTQSTVWWTEASTTSRPEEWWTQSTTRMTSPWTTTTAGKPIKQSCSNGQYLAVPGECNAFYICVNGRLVKQSCAPGLSWSQDKQLCDWAHQVKCTPEPDSYETNNPYIKEETPQSQPCEPGQYSSYPGDCRQYMICMFGNYAAFSCASGLHWNQKEKICDWPANAGCEGQSHQPDSGQGVVVETETESTSYRPPSTSYKPPTTATFKPTTLVTTSPATTVPPPSSTYSGYFKIVCYFTNWAWYRQGDGKYLPEDIDKNLCTHIVYGFAVLDYENLVIKAHDSWADFDNKFYERVTAYKKKGLKVTLAIGGWNDSLGDKYSRLVNNPNSRRKFISHVIEFLQKHNFDGLDLDWEYPKCWQVDCKKGPDSDKQAFSAFVKELHEAFKPYNFLLSAAVSPNKIVVDAGYDVPAMGQYLDWVAVMTYDYHGQWDKKTGHVAPMYLHPDDESPYFHANYSINYWIDQGVPRRNIVMGMPLYGQSFQLAGQNKNGLNANAPGPGQAGEFTRAAGFLAYYEICKRINSGGWTVVQDPEKRMGPYAYKGNQWVSFDDVDMIRLKTQYVRDMDLGGAMIWALDLDDFRNRCGGGKHPLLSTIRNGLSAAPDSTNIITTSKPAAIPETSSEQPSSVAPPVFDQTGPPTVTVTSTTTPLPTEPTWRPDPQNDFKVVCYFTNWAWYRQGPGKYAPSDIDPDLCTHIVYSWATLDGDNGVIKYRDAMLDRDSMFYEKVTQYRARGIKVLIAIGGWTDSAGNKYSRLVNKQSARAKFIADVVKFIETNHFDGLQIDWNYPKCWQGDCNAGPDSDKIAFSEFVKELKTAFIPKGYLLSSGFSPNVRLIDAGYEVGVLNQYLDWMAVNTWDYHGEWDQQTGHLSPLMDHPDDPVPHFNSNATITHLVRSGADPKKLLLSFPMYGQSFTLANPEQHDLNSKATGGGEPGDFTRQRGFLSYYEICHNIREKGWKVVRDREERMGPYAYLQDQWVGFDDQSMVRKKSEYLKYYGLGGASVWSLDLDDFRNRCNCETYPLIKTINRVLRGYPGPGPVCNLGDEGVRQEVTTQVPSQAPLSCTGRLFADHHHDCNKYYQCQHGAMYEMSCPPGLHWNQDHCDWPENAHCKVEQGNEVIDIGTTPQITTPVITRPTTPTAPTYKPTTVTTIWQPTTQPTRPTVKGDYKVVCYFTNWAWYRQGIGKYTPDNVDYELCTHIAYGFAVLDGNTLTIKPHDSWADIDNEFYRKVTELKKKGVKVLIALGGWNDSLGDKYSRLVSNPESRRRFIEHVLQFIEKYNFDGLDLDWEYPKCWQVDCNAGPADDKRNFASLVEELSHSFKPKGLLLSSAVSPSKVVIDSGYDVAKLSRYFDYISVMTYDFHGHWDKMTGHVAPLDYYPGDTYDYFNANFSINYWIEKGADRRKIIMGMPFYGQSFSLADPTKHGLNEKAPGPGQAGEFTRAAGFLSFYEICDNVKRQGWQVVRDPEGRIGPYAYKGNQWVSYDDVADIRRKANFVKKMGLGGGMLWALDLDDFRNRCGCGTHPLLKTLNRELRGVGEHFTDCT